MYLRNVEPTIEELLDDPIAHLLIARDRLQSEQVWAYVNDAKRRLRNRKIQGREATADNPPDGLLTCEVREEAARCARALGIEASA